MAWVTIDDGETIGTTGSECGVIVRDEEHTLGARTTLERDCSVGPFGITCGIYGSMCHTTWASDEARAGSLFEAMKVRIEELLAIPDGDLDAYYAALQKFVRDF